MMQIQEILGSMFRFLLERIFATRENPWGNWQKLHVLFNCFAAVLNLKLLHFHSFNEKTSISFSKQITGAVMEFFKHRMNHENTQISSDSTWKKQYKALTDSTLFRGFEFDWSQIFALRTSSILKHNKCFLEFSFHRD